MSELNYKIVSFDLDGTIILGTTSTLHFAELLGVQDQVVKLEVQFNQGKMTSTTFMHKISKIMGSLTQKFIDDHFHTIPIIRGLSETVATLKRAGLITTIVTTSNQMFAEAFQRKFGFDYVFGTTFDLLQNGCLGKGKEVCSSTHKIKHLKRLAGNFGVELDQVLAVGDSISDIPLFSKVGRSIAINFDNRLKNKANVYLRTNDMRSILPYVFSYDQQ